LVFLTIKDTAMNFRNIALIAAAIAALSPAICNASPEKDGINACARAFATTLAAPGADAPAFKVTYRNGQHFGSMLEYYIREYNFDLHVNDKKSGLPIARAKCSTDAHGAIVAFAPIAMSN
jgi:hypothetical protein